MFTPENKIDYIKIATEIAEWVERNFGYFVNKNSDKAKVIQDFSEQLERLPIESMSYIQQAKNNFIDKGDARPPTPLVFIQELKIILIKNNNNKKPVYFDKVKYIVEQLYAIKNDTQKIKYIKTLSARGKLKLEKKSIATLEIQQILERNNFEKDEIRKIITD